MTKIELYSKDNCAFCDRAKLLLKRKGLKFEEYRVDLDPKRMEEFLVRAPGRRTLPQIFINDQLIGTCDDLYEMESKGELDKHGSEDSLLHKPEDDE